MTLKGVKIQLYPTIQQKQSIERNFTLNRFLWNQLLAMQKERYENGGSFVNKFGMNYLIKAMKWEFPFLKEAESTSLLYASADLADSFDRFFQKQNAFPRFKSRKRPKNSYKSNCVNGNIQVVDNHYLKLPKLGLMKAYGLERIRGKIKSAVIRKESTGKYTASILVEEEMKKLPLTEKSIGIDLGLTHLAIHSDGTKLNNKHFERSLAKKKRTWERKLARRRRLALEKMEAHKETTGEELELSSFRNVQKAKEMVAKYNRKIRNQRNDYLHKYTTHLVQNYDTIVLEDLRTQNMMKNRKLSRSIADASWAIIKSMLAYKCAWYGKNLVLVNAAYTSQDCSACGRPDGKKPLHIREWTCPGCHAHHDRDINAARNILAKASAGR